MCLYRARVRGQPVGATPGKRFMGLKVRAQTYFTVYIGKLTSVWGMTFHLSFLKSIYLNQFFFFRPTASLNCWPKLVWASTSIKRIFFSKICRLFNKRSTFDTVDYRRHSYNQWWIYWNSLCQLINLFTTEYLSGHSEWVSSLTFDWTLYISIGCVMLIHKGCWLWSDTGAACWSHKLEEVGYSFCVWITLLLYLFTD